MLHGISPVWKSHYISNFIGYDPVETIKRIAVPTLALFGENDRLVPPSSNEQRLRENFGTRSGNSDLHIHTIPGVNHGFERGDFCEREVKSNRLASEFFDALDNQAFWSTIDLA